MGNSAIKALVLLTSYFEPNSVQLFSTKRLKANVVKANEHNQRGTAHIFASRALRWAIKNKLHSESALLDSLGMNNTDILKKTCSKPKKQLRCTDDDNGAAIKIGMKTVR
ncbi:hypothetical protein V1477_016176 [Vespula maculifrons]|uniref:Uncharacterized protein n=2 Tax=Vespula TaxID=7451 RepID=A0A834K3M7_VESVU|nr:hypothetical protein HZH66_006699 [Vespula vulgaris]